MKITKRDIAFFILGIFTIYIIESIIDWEGTKKSYIEGVKDANSIYKTESKTK
ncbi:hypothetical protein [Polaribacter sp.]|uniref:hypothetical protein n=1 Tax=Polaribacter sp. TaxID=1920175 RepID=UPI0040483AD7